MLFLATYLLSAPTMMGMIIVGLLTADMFSAKYIMIAAAAGAVVALPVAWLVSNKLVHLFDAKRT